MYNGSWTKKTRRCEVAPLRFYLKKFEVSNTLCATDGTVLPGVKFPSQGTPVPETTIGSTSYSERLPVEYRRLYLRRYAGQKTRRFPGR